MATERVTGSWDGPAHYDRWFYRALGRHAFAMCGGRGTRPTSLSRTTVFKAANPFPHRPQLSFPVSSALVRWVVGPS